MAKKKKKKEDEKKKFEYSNEVIGIALILASIIGIGAYGPAGNFIRAFAIFLVGNIYIFLLAGILILGGYLIVKRKTPDFFNLRWIGFYIITISFLILLHTKYITLNAQEGTKILTETFDNLLKVFSETNGNAQVSIIDITGRIVKEVETTENVTTISVNDINRGVYFINVEQNNGVSTTQKIVVTK